MERIDFEITESETENPKKVKEACIVLHEDYVQYKVDYYLDEKDELLGWVKNKYIFYDQYASKDAVMGVHLSYKHKHDKWCVNIYLLGHAEDIWVHFYDEQKAIALFKKIMNWKYKK